MKQIVINNWGGPFYCSMPKSSKKDIIVLHPGVNEVDVDEFEAAKKHSNTVKLLLEEKIKSSKAPEARSEGFGRPRLELWGKPGPDVGFLLKQTTEDALWLIEHTENTDLLWQWDKQCGPGKDITIRQAIQQRMKDVAALIEGVSNSGN